MKKSLQKIKYAITTDLSPEMFFSYIKYFQVYQGSYQGSNQEPRSEQCTIQFMPYDKFILCSVNWNQQSMLQIRFNQQCIMDKPKSQAYIIEYLVNNKLVWYTPEGNYLLF